MESINFNSDSVKCAVINGELHKSSISGEWLKTDENSPADKCLVSAFEEYKEIFSLFKMNVKDGIYEAVGVHFGDNPRNLKYDILVPCGESEQWQI